MHTWKSHLYSWKRCTVNYLIPFDAKLQYMPKHYTVFFWSSCHFFVCFLFLCALFILSLFVNYCCCLRLVRVVFSVVLKTIKTNQQLTTTTKKMETKTPRSHTIQNMLYVPLNAERVFSTCLYAVTSTRNSIWSLIGG